MAAEILPPEIIPFIWFGGIAITIYVFFHRFSDVIKEKFKHSTAAKRKEEKNVHTDGQIDDLVNNAPRMVNEINKIIAEQKSAGVPDEKMKGLYQKKQMLELVSNNSEVINILGKPILKKAVSYINKVF